jgi:hypothetical protein
MHGQPISAAIVGSTRWLVEASSRASAGDAPKTRARQEPPFCPSLSHQILLLHKIQKVTRVGIVFRIQIQLPRVCPECMKTGRVKLPHASKQGNNRGGWEVQSRRHQTKAGTLVIRCRPSSSHKTVLRCSRLLYSLSCIQ